MYTYIPVEGKMHMLCAWIQDNMINVDDEPLTHQNSYEERDRVKRHLCLFASLTIILRENASTLPAVSLNGYGEKG